MKKTTIIMAFAAVCGLASCNAQGSKADLRTDVDSLSYNMGVTSTQGLQEYLVRGMGVDTTYMAEFLKGVQEGVKAGDDKQLSAYYAGIQIGQRMSTQMIQGMNQQVFGADSTKTLSMNNLLAGFMDAINKKANMEESQAFVEAKMKVIQEKALLEQFGENKKAGEDFLAANAKKEGVKVLDGGVQYKVLQEGNGPVPADTSKVVVNYKGTLIDGTEFDSSYKRNEPAKFRANQVIKGWTTALTHMPVGSKWEVYIPQELGYAERGGGQQIQPFSALIFEIELLGIE